jgi:hypothetical protein
MTKNQNEYENIDGKLSDATASVYLNPIFDDNDEVKTILLSILNLSHLNTIPRLQHNCHYSITQMIMNNRLMKKLLRISQIKMIQRCYV